MEPAVTPKTRTLRITFNETPEDQALYDALCRTSEKEIRTPLTRQAKYLLRMALGLHSPDLWMLKRMGLSEEDPDALATEAAKTVAARKFQAIKKPDLRPV